MKGAADPRPSRVWLRLCRTRERPPSFRPIRGVGFPGSVEFSSCSNRRGKGWLAHHHPERTAAPGGADTPAEGLTTRSTDLPMAEENPRRLGRAERDAREELRVLREVLTIYPESLTLAELIRELTVAPPEGCDEDGVNVAVLELMGCGLLHRLGDLVLPTRPAVVFYSLTEAGEI